MRGRGAQRLTPGLEPASEEIRATEAWIWGFQQGGKGRGVLQPRKHPKLDSKNNEATTPLGKGLHNPHS